MTAPHRKQVDEIAGYYDTHDTSDQMDGGRIVDAIAEPMVVTSLRLPKSTMDALRREADRRGTRPTQLIRLWVDVGLATMVSGEATVPVSQLLELVRRAEPPTEPAPKPPAPRPRPGRAPRAQRGTRRKTR